MKILMVRSPSSLLNQNLIGYGWSKVNFSQYDNVVDLMQKLNQTYPKGIGRHEKSITRFFNLQTGDIVIVPLSKTIAIGEVEGKKSFDASLIKSHACNLVAVNFYCTEDGSILKILRKSLPQGLESRLRIRKSNTDLKDFYDEIQEIIRTVKSTGVYKQESYILNKMSEVEQDFKKRLLNSISSGTTWLAAGGRGLEELVAELLSIEGYSAKIQAKQQSSSSGITDIDITASKVDRFSESHLFIQVKHHAHTSGRYGLKQLIDVDDLVLDDLNYQKWLITTADLSEDSLALAEQHNIKVMVGSEFIDWLYEHINALSDKTKQRLGIIDIPTLVTTR